MSDPVTAPTRSVTWRLERWSTDRSTDHLIFTDMFALPTVQDFEKAAWQSARRGAKALRTSALFPRSQAQADAAGFVPIDRLQLLRMNLDHHNVDQSPWAASPAKGRRNTAQLRARHLVAASRVDRLAFGPVWGNSAQSLQAILGATEQARAQVYRSPRSLRSSVDGFVISGITDKVGYIQRLAVHPDARRQGLARALLADGLRWMRKQGVSTVFVNTGVDNYPALRLYDSIGFTPTGETLTIHERDDLAQFNTSRSLAADGVRPPSGVAHRVIERPVR